MNYFQNKSVYHDILNHKLLMNVSFATVIAESKTVREPVPQKSFQKKGNKKISQM